MPQLNRFLMEEVELPLIPVVADLEDIGYLIDKNHFTMLRQRLEADRARVMTAIQAHTGADFNPASPKQVAELLFDKLQLPALKMTDSGNKSTDEATLNSLADQHEIVPLLLQHRSLTKIIGTYCSIPDSVKEDGRYYASFDQLGAETGRFSSKGIIQTLPKDDDLGIRKGFIAGPGKRIVAADYVQQELYVLASVSGDRNMLLAIKDDIDLHGLAAVKVYGLMCEPNEVKNKHKDERDRVKAIQFGIIYGKGPQALAQELGISIEEALTLLKDYFKQFPSVKRFIDNVHARVTRDGFIDDLFGRRRYLPNAQLPPPRKKYASMSEEEKSINGKINAAKRAAQNFVIQGASATITKLAMIRCHHHITTEHPDIRMLLTLHDELQHEVPEAKVDRFAAELPRLMTDLGLERFDFHVPMKIEIKTGPTWGDLRPYPPKEERTCAEAAPTAK
jgi:DNA polymerase I